MNKLADTMKKSHINIGAHNQQNMSTIQIKFFTNSLLTFQCKNNMTKKKYMKQFEVEKWADISIWTENH